MLYLLLIRWESSCISKIFSNMCADRIFFHLRLIFQYRKDTISKSQIADKLGNGMFFCLCIGFRNSALGYLYCAVFKQVGQSPNHRRVHG